MARTTLLPTPPLNADNLNDSFKTSQKSLSQTQTSVKNISDLLVKKTKVRKEIFSSILEDRKKRDLESRRREREDEIEAKKTVSFGGIGSIVQSASAAGGSFLDRIIKALGFIAAGWILRRLPTWIGYAKEFIARVEELGRIIRSFVGNVTNFFSSLFNTLGELKNNLLRFDLFDSQRNVRDSFDELVKSIEGMGNDFQDTIDVFTTDLTKQIDGVRVGSYSEEPIPEQGEGFTPPTSDSSGSDSGGSSASGGGRWKPLLDLIHTVESSTDKQNNGYDAQNGAPRGVRPGLSKMTIGEIARSAPGASGRYQQMPQFLLDRAKAAGYNENTVFSPEVQDALAIKLIESRGGNDWLSGKMSTEQFMQGLSQEWAALPNASGKFAYRGQSSSLRSDKVKSVLEQVKKTPSQQPSSSPSRATSTPTGTNLMGQRYFRPLPQGSFKGSPSQRFGASRGNRSHLGIDITESNWKPGSDPRIPVVAIMGGTVIQERYVGGSQYLSGLMIRQDDGYDARYLHMTPSVKPGDRVEAGQKIGRLVNLGDQTHLHFELYKGKQVIDPTSYISKIERGEMPKATVAARPPSTQAPSTPAAQISPPAPTQQRQQGVAQQITPERKAQDIVAVVPSAQQQPQQNATASQQTQQKPTPSVGDMLNNFIKQKFLLDLSYL